MYSLLSVVPNRMGNAASAQSVLTTVASHVAFIGACIRRKGDELSELVDQETSQSIHIPSRRSAALVTPSQKFSTPPLSARSRQNITDREDHLLLSARSIAIQKKAPLFRDTGEEDAENQPQPLLSGRKLDMNLINEMVQRDKIRRSIAF